MAHSFDLSSINQLHASASQGQHSHVIEQSIVISQGLVDLHLNVLDLRARSYVACAQFENALKTATTMQQMYPSSALGYLCQGYIHMEQGRFIAACDVYNTALARVDKSDPSYDTITTMKTMAAQQPGKRKDFIGDLPLDIALIIIQQLLLIHSHYRQQREYVMVSSNWYHRFMASRHFQYTLRSTIPFEETDSRVIESLRHVRILKLECCKPSFNQLFQKYQFTCLTKLIIHGTEIRNHDQTILALKSISEGLTHLSLDYPMHSVHHCPETRIKLQNILATCPNLVSLDVHGNVVIRTIDDTYPKLKELKLYAVHGTVDNQHMMMFRQHLPGLKTLHLTIVGRLQPLTIDDTWMPAIRHLGYGVVPNHQRKLYTWKDSGCQGLSSLSININSTSLALDDVTSLIISHHATLQALELQSHLDTMQNIYTFDAMNNQQHIQFKQMTALVVDIPSNRHSIDRYLKLITWIIERSPYLQTVTLERYALDKHVLQALTRCIHLCSLTMETSINQRLCQNVDIAEFLRDHVMYMADQGGSRLDSISMQFNHALPTLIHAMGQLTRLRSLKLFAHRGSPCTLVQLFESLRHGCQRLSYVFIWSHGIIPNSLFYQISGLPSLESLTIRGDLRDAQVGIISLQHCHLLRHLHCSTTIGVDVRTMLIESIPGLDIRVQYPFPIAQ